MKGIITSKDGYGIDLEVGGIGYRLDMPSKALDALPAVGSAAQVWVYLQVKDDGMSLFGFHDQAEKEMFTRLIGVSGIGPKMAVAALSTFTPAQLASAIAAGDVASLATVPGIGKKTAQRAVLELQGLLETESSLFGAAVSADPAATAMADASAALLGMGFSSAEISSSLEGCALDDASAIVRYALRNLGGA